MKIQLISIYAGPEGTLSPGIHSLPKEKAIELLKAGYAREVVEEATIAPKETTAKRKAK